MSAIFIAVVLLSGFIYSDQNIKTKFRLARSTGWVTYFLAGVSGIYFALAAGIALLLLNTSGGYQIAVEQGATLVSTSKSSVQIVIWGGISLLLAHFWGKYRYLLSGLGKTPRRTAKVLLTRRLHRLFPKAVGTLKHFRSARQENAERTVQEAAYELAVQNEFEQMLYASAATVRMLQITLKSGKVYIGYVNETSNPRKTDNTEYFTLFPLLSGYRNRRTHELVITTNYYDAYRRIFSNDIPFDDIRIEFKTLIPRLEVSAMAFFDADYYDQFVQRETVNTARATAHGSGRFRRRNTTS